MTERHWPTWFMTVAALPAAIMLWVLIGWTPETKKQWLWASAMALYIAFYYFFFVR